MYRYYQKIGGEEPWTPIQAHLSLDEIRPTFATVLSVDTLIDNETPKELVQKAKYSGPMYFDLDAEDLQDSIQGARELLKKLQDNELQAQDIQIFLSGKKGLHIIIPDVCFMAKPGVAVQNLPAIYKEIAFKFAVDPLDIRVYTARRGRQLRTCYNVRENGNYRVPITLKELETLTPDEYQVLCKTPRVVQGHDPKWRGKFALVYDSALQKIGKLKPKVRKPVPAEILKEQLPIFKRLATGDATSTAGFNVTAMQLALYALEMKWSEQVFMEQCEGIINNHVSDGSRYNSPARRARELRRMYAYLEDNPGFEYSVQGLRACTKAEPVQAHAESSDDEGNWEEASEFDEPQDEFFAGVYAGTSAYMASKGEDGDVKVTNFLFKNPVILRDIKSGAILHILATLKGGQVNLTPTAFTGGTALQNAVSGYGGSFSGTDNHARGIYQAMLREVKEHTYVLTSEGVNLIRPPAGVSSKDYIVWADREGIRCAEDMDIKLTFLGDPDPRGLYQTDLTSAPTLDDLLSTAEGRQETIATLKAMMGAHTADVMGKMLGWTIACFYAPLFQAIHKQFPLLHVYGPAGNGKTSTVRGLLRHFYYRQSTVETSPSSTVFALQQLLAGSASIPLLLDEYKPHVMREKIEPFRGVLRDAYNAKAVQRGGGNKRVSDNFNALSTIQMQAPVVVIGEAPETETAIVERSIMVSFKRLAGREQSEAFKNAMTFQRSTEVLASLGLEIANDVVQTNNAEDSLAHFDNALRWAHEKFLSAPEDLDKVEAGEMTPEEMRTRALMRPRPVYNSTVALFGLSRLKAVLYAKLGEADYETHFGERMRAMSKGVYQGMTDLAEATLPEYVKVLTMFADMSKLEATDTHKLSEGVEYNISEIGGQSVLVIAPRQCYLKYRAYMRNSGSTPLYPSDESFVIALREVPQFVKNSYGTKKLETATVVLDLEGLYRAAVPRFAGKVVELQL